MHPMAAYCALKGLVLVDFDRGNSKFFRITPLRDVADQCIGLHKSELECPQPRWGRLSRISSIEIFVPTPWGTIPDSAWDQLPQKLVDEVFG